VGGKVGLVARKIKRLNPTKRYNSNKNGEPANPRNGPNKCPEKGGASRLVTGRTLTSREGVWDGAPVSGGPGMAKKQTMGFAGGGGAGKRENRNQKWGPGFEKKNERVRMGLAQGKGKKVKVGKKSKTERGTMKTI